MCLRIVTYEYFRDYCKKCEFYEVKGSGYKHYCHLDKNLEGCISHRRRRLRIKIQPDCGIKRILEEREERERDKAINYSQGFSDCDHDHNFSLPNSADTADKIKAYIAGFKEAKRLNRAGD